MLVSNRPLTVDALLSAAHAWQYFTKDLRAPAVRDCWLSRLPADEVAHYDQLQTKRSREGYLAARVLSRAVLSRYTGVDPSHWRFGASLLGKPAVIEPAEFASLRFNLTRTDDLVIFLITRAGEVGVDAEKISRAVDDRLLARHFLSDHEQARLETLPSSERPRRFFEQWVLKEAYVKATGKGLAYSPERLTIEQDQNGQPIAFGNCQFFVVLAHPEPRRRRRSSFRLQSLYLDRMV